jgi:hypothetical protein
MNRAGRGRPLRFVGVVGLGWIGLRCVLLWPPVASTLPAAARLAPGKAVTAVRASPQPMARPPARAALVPSPRRRALPDLAREDRRQPLPSQALDTVPSQQRFETQGAGVVSVPVVTQAFPGQRPDPPVRTSPRRWSASAWLALRPGQGIGVAPTAGQLGGSQYGVRVVRALDPRGRLAAVGRVAGPLRGQGAEVALGFEWRPAGTPVRIAVEERLGLDGIHGGPGLGAVVGLYRQRAAFGIGSWGAVQRGVQRLDIGPTLVTSVPIGALQARIALDWRQRIAGNARPGSGIALTLGSDF